MAVEYLGTGNDDGVVLGRAATDKVGFHGAAPAAKTTLSLSGALTAGTTTAASVAAAFVELYTELKTKGLVG